MLDCSILLGILSIEFEIMAHIICKYQPMNAKLFCSASFVNSLKKTKAKGLIIVLSGTMTITVHIRIRYGYSTHIKVIVKRKDEGIIETRFIDDTNIDLDNPFPRLDFDASPISAFDSAIFFERR